MAKTEEKQVEETKEQSTEKTQETSEESGTLSEEETVEKVSELLGEQVSEEQPIEKTQETSKEETPVPVIDDEFVKKYPATKAYYGKPVTELGQPYQAIVKEFYDTRKEISELKKKLAEATIPKLEDEPDPVDYPEEHKKWTKEREEAIRADERSKLAEQPQQVNYAAELTSRLPADVDTMKVIEAWTNDNAYRLFDKTGNWRPEILAQYDNEPEIFYQEVTKFYKDETMKQKTDEEIRKAGFKKAQSDFKKARKTKKDMPKANVNVVERTTKASETDRMLENIYHIVQEE